MNQITPKVEIKNDIPVTTSLEIARVFEKRHKNVMQAIGLLEIPEEYRRLNFQQASYTRFQNQFGKKVTHTEPMYLITRDGFTLLAMGFTGRKATQFKIAYIEAFNKMEQALRQAAVKTTSAPFQQDELFEDDEAVPIPPTIPAASVPAYTRAILMARNGYKKREIAHILNRPPSTISTWFNRYEPPVSQRLVKIFEWFDSAPGRFLPAGLRARILENTFFC